jgi:hypothetical protein
MLPAVALAAGAGACWIGRALFGRSGPLGAALAATAVFAVAAAALLQGRADVLFRLDTVQASRRIYGANPFPEAIEIGRYLAAHTTPSDTIAVLGSEPEIYFYSGRHSATGYIYTYGLMEAQAFASRMQDEMISEIEAARPAYIVMVSVPVSWLIRKTSDRKILAWAERYVAERYDRVGVIDIVSATQTEYRWDEQASRYENRGANFLTVYRRRAPAAG